MSARVGIGSTTLGFRTSCLAIAAALVLMTGASCSRADAATGIPSARRQVPDAGHVSVARANGPDGGGNDNAALPVVEEGDCSAICEKLLRCKQGPWTKPADCTDACDASNEDAISGRTYRCVAKAKSCDRMKKCTR